MKNYGSGSNVLKNYFVAILQVQSYYQKMRKITNVLANS